jgi:hypothetical protein
MNKTNGHGFKEAFYSLPANKLKDVQAEIIRELEWSTVNFYSKRNGTRRLRNSEAHLLSKIFAQYGIEFTIA